MADLNSVVFDGHKFTYDRDPDECPICHHAATPELITSWRDRVSPYPDAFLEIVYRCPRHLCGHLFIGQFVPNPDTGSTYLLADVQPSTPVRPKFPPDIEEVSADFVAIYTEAAMAQSLGLKQIVGVGYRKALEFLVKDYCISLKPAEVEEIKKTPLGRCIENRIDDARIKECAKRAAWLGNDETHYLRKWEDKDIKDLKRLIQLTVGWISNCLLTKQYLDEMPE